MKHVGAALCLSMLALLCGCVTVPTLPAAKGGAQFEFTTSTLKPRSGLYQNEKARFVVFRKSDNALLGGGDLTIEHPTSVAALPTDTPLLIRVFESIPLFSAMMGCNSEADFTLTNDKHYKMQFNFSVNYDDHSASTCVSALQVTTLNGEVVENRPLKATFSSSSVPLFIPIPIP